METREFFIFMENAILEMGWVEWIRLNVTEGGAQKPERGQTQNGAHGMAVAPQKALAAFFPERSAP